MITPYLPLFQFHKGTIKTKRDEPIAYIIGYFNSIKVRLKLHNLCRLQVQKHEFQFHKGTIKTS